MKTAVKKAPAKKPAQQFRETGTGTLKGVEIFMSGLHRDKEYTDADLDQIAANFERFSAGAKPLLHVPAVLGHEETQEFLDRSDLPAAAWGTKVYREGHKLKADFEDMPAAVTRLIQGKRYRKVSAEIYDEPPEGIAGEGKMLRRVAFLGGEIPQVKDLADIPMPEIHAESGARVLRFSEIRAGKLPGVFHVFAEVQPMSHEELVQALTDAGIDPALFGTLPDPVLAAWVASIQEEDEPDPANMTPEAKAQLAETYSAKAAKYAACPAKMEDPNVPMADPTIPMADPTAVLPPVHTPPAAAKPSPTPPPAAGSPPPKSTTVTHKFSEEQEAAIRSMLDAVKTEVLQTIKPMQATVTKFGEEADAGKKLLKVDNALSTYRDRIKPSLLDGTSGLPTLRDDLLRMDDKAVVHKFKEGGKVRDMTELDIAIEKIKREKPVKFGERLTAGKKADGSEEVEKVAEFYGRPEMADALKAAGKKPSDYVQRFSELHKKNPTITAVEFGVTAA